MKSIENFLSATSLTIKPDLRDLDLTAILDSSALGLVT